MPRLAPAIWMALALAIACPAHAATLTLNPVADAYVDSSQPSLNTGGSAKLRADASPAVRSYLRFDVQGTGGQVTKATLRLNAMSSLGTGVDVRAVGDNSWTELGITHSNAPAAGTVAGSTTPFSAGQWITADVTPLVTGDGVVSVAVTSANTTAAALASRESVNAPQLIVETGGVTTPPPSNGVTLNPTADAYVDSSQPALNTGTQTKLRADTSPTVRSYVRFDVQGLSGAITKATLRLMPTSSLSAGVQVRPVSDNTWTETGITYANATPPGTGGPSSGALQSGQWASVDVTSLVTATGRVTLALNGASSTAVALASRESTTKPELVVQSSSSPPPPPPSGDPVIAAAGDIACDPASVNYNSGVGTATACRELYTSDLLVAGGYTAVLALGDLQYEVGAADAFQQSYDPTWGRVKSITHPAVGNHEYGTTGATGYFDYFDGAGNQTGPAGDRSQGWYSYDVGTWHVIALNSNCTRVSCAAGSAQEQWLRADLAAHPAQCTLAYWHHPRFSSGANGNSAAVQPFWDDLYAANADVILNGHDHDYERFAPQAPDATRDDVRGIRELVAGTGGKSHSTGPGAQPNSELRDSSSYGVLELTLHASGYDWRFKPESGAVFTDAGSGICH